MTATKPGIDHLVHAVHDLAAAREIFSGFGFTLTPEARHPFGTGNSLAQLQGNFLELLAVVEPEKLVPMSEGRFSFGAFNRDFLAEREGLSMLVLTSDDSERDRRLWAERGLQAFEPLHFERQAKQPDGSAAKVAFSLAFAVDPALPKAAYFVCQQHNPEAFWQPRYQSHENGAQCITGVTIVSKDPAAHRAFFEALVAPEAVRLEDGRLEVALDGGRIEVVSPDALAARFAAGAAIDVAAGPAIVAATVSVADLAAARRLLQAGGVGVTERPEAIEIAPDTACGLLLELVPR